MEEDANVTVVKITSMPAPSEKELPRDAFARALAEANAGRVSRQDYAAAVVRLVGLAQQPTSGGRAAAQVLLSAYNGFDWQLDVTDLSSLDRGNFEAAMAVIRGRRDNWSEPHEVIDNGGRVFRDLCRRWSRLHVAQRGKVDCPSCDGRGRVYSDPYGDKDDGPPCTRCQGTGRLCRCQVS